MVRDEDLFHEVPDADDATGRIDTQDLGRQTAPTDDAPAQDDAPAGDAGGVLSDTVWQESRLLVWDDAREDLPMSPMGVGMPPQDGAPVVPAATFGDEPVLDEGASPAADTAALPKTTPTVEEVAPEPQVEESTGTSEGAEEAPESDESGQEAASEAGEDTAGEEAQEMAAGDQDRRKRRKRTIIIVVVALLVCGGLVAGYMWGLDHFAGRFLVNTTINGLDVSELTPDEAVARLEQETADYTMHIGVGDYEGAFKGEHITLERDELALATSAFDHVDVRLWPLRYLVAIDYEMDPCVTFDEDVLRDVVMHSVDDHNEMALPTDDAEIDYDEDLGSYVLSGTTEGTAVDKFAVADAAVDSALAFSEECAPEADVALHEATVEDLPAYAYAVTRANLVRSSDVPILVNGEQVDELTSEQAQEWVKIDTDVPEVWVDTDGLEYWANETLVYSVYHRDDWSNYYLDVDAFVEGLTERLKLGVVEGYEAPTTEELRTEGSSRKRAYERGGWDSKLGRYIDVDLEAQFVRLFDEKGEVIWESACVSGDMYESRSTVTGTFEIYEKGEGVTLVGLDYNNDGKPDYESYVSYWMPFYGGYGLHDATWRSSFGGDYFYYDGSHGCINLPYDKAEELYKLVSVGEKVNVHW